MRRRESRRAAWLRAPARALEARGKANDRFLEPIKARCAACDVVYARCERELQPLEFALLAGDAVPMHVVVAPGMRLAMDGPIERVRRP